MLRSQLEITSHARFTLPQLLTTSWLMIRILIFISLMFSALQASPHGHGGGEGVEALADVMSDAIDLAPSILKTTDASAAWTKVGGRKVYLNGPFWQLVRGWIRVYYHELHRDGGIQVTEEHFMAQADAEIARSFAAIKIGDPVMEGIEHIVVGSADINARLGKTAFVAKAAAEVGEGVASKLIGGGGVHVFCTAIDAAILFGTRHLQTSYRTLAWAPSLKSWRLGNLAKWGFYTGSMYRAKKRATFELEEGVEVDEQELRELDLEGPNRWWGWAKDGKRAAWVKKVLAKKNGRLRGREFLGGRMKRYLIIFKGRKRAHRQFMAGKTTMDQVLNRDVVWVMSVQENILQRALVADPAVSDPMLRNPPLAFTSTPEHDEIRESLAAEFSPENKEFIAGLLRDVEVIFNPNVPQRQRYFQATVLESLLAGFVYNAFSQVIGERGEMYGASLRGIGRQWILHSRAGGFASYVYEWADFLRLVAMQSHPQKLQMQKYETMEALLRLFKHLQKNQDLLMAENVDDLLKSVAKLKVTNQELRTFRPWQEKKRARSWWPWGRRATCRELEEMGP